MYDRFRLGAAWLLTFVLCVRLIATAYWNLHWRIIPLWQIEGGISVSDNSIIKHKKMQEELASLKSLAIAKLEHRGYEVRGKTTAQIRQILKRHPTKPTASTLSG
jgi:hypothetical protein